MHTRAGIAGGSRARSFRLGALGLILAALCLLPGTGQAAPAKTAHSGSRPVHHPFKAAARLVQNAGHWLHLARPLAKKLTAGFIAPYALHP
jgi:hypothetical protein